MRIAANGIAIEAEAHGPEDGAPLLLIRGLGSQLIHWPARLLDGLSAAGFRVIVFDNRDSGLSEKFAGKGTASAPAYALEDMADDAVGVLDAFGVASAHALGISMGGMILQIMARRHRRRVRSAVIVMSSTGDPALPRRPPEIEALLLSQPEDPTDRAQAIEHALKCDRAWGGPGFPFDEAERRALIGRAFDRCHDPEGVARQFAAVTASLPRLAGGGPIEIPATVIHGTDDALLSIEHGRAVAARIPGARFVAVPGMGHDLEGGVADVLVAEATRLARAVDGAGAGKRAARGDGTDAPTRTGDP